MDNKKKRFIYKKIKQHTGCERRRGGESRGEVVKRRGREKKISFTCWFTPQLGLTQAEQSNEARNSIRVSRVGNGSKHLGHPPLASQRHVQGTGLEGDQLEAKHGMPAWQLTAKPTMPQLQPLDLAAWSRLHCKQDLTWTLFCKQWLSQKGIPAHTELLRGLE